MTPDQAPARPKVMRSEQTMSAEPRSRSWLPPARTSALEILQLHGPAGNSSNGFGPAAGLVGDSRQAPDAEAGVGSARSPRPALAVATRAHRGSKAMACRLSRLSIA